jgi:hypothetical protein
MRPGGTWRRWLEAAVEDPDALWSPDAPEELIDELEERNLIIHMYRREEWAWIDQPPPEKDPEIGVGGAWLGTPHCIERR